MRKKIGIIKETNREDNKPVALTKIKKAEDKKHNRYQVVL